MNLIVVSRNFCISDAVTTFALIYIKFFSDRLPGSRPVIVGFVVTDIDVASGLVKIIEDVAQDSSVCTRLCKAVAACVVRDDSTVLGRA